LGISQARGPLSAMKFTIVIPTHNGGKYLYDTLMSACNQMRKADEVVVSDDGSTDGTLDICNSDVFEGKITVYKNPDGPSGFVKAWMRAIQISKGEYISILHQDDLLHPLFLRSVESALRKYPNVKHVFAACDYIDENGNVFRTAKGPYSIEPVLLSGKEYRKNYLRASIADAHIHRCPGVVTHKEIFEYCNYRPEAGHIADDDFFFRVGNYTDVIGISEPMASYRHHIQSETGKLSKAELTLRLAKDYTYQSQFHSRHDYFDADDLELLKQVATGSVNSLMYYGLILQNTAYLDVAQACKYNLVSSSDNEFYRYVKLHYRLMWLLATKYKLKKVSLCYASMIKHARNIKRILKHSLTKVRG
jgi:glycosyltransferase involved in cell wall biosynthesis